MTAVFAANGIASLNTYSFVPHLTVLKMPKKSKNGIEPSTYAHLLGTEFGSQPIEGLELLSMTKPYDAEGYYYCFHRSSFK